MRLINLAFLLMAATTNLLAQNINQNQQNININLSSLPVIEKPVYVTKYRTVYVEKEQPKRIAKKLSQPVRLLGYLWVFPYDIGDFKRQKDAKEIVDNINRQGLYGRNNWRIPTPGELSAIEQNADIIGLGDGIYLATDHANGILRLVSTGLSIAEQYIEANRQWAVEEERRRLEEERLQAEERRRAEIERRKEEERMKNEDIRERILLRQRQ